MRSPPGVSTCWGPGSLPPVSSHGESGQYQKEPGVCLLRPCILQTGTWGMVMSRNTKAVGKRAQRRNQGQYCFPASQMSHVLISELSSGNRTEWKGHCWDLIWTLLPTSYVTPASLPTWRNGDGLGHADIPSCYSV